MITETCKAWLLHRRPSGDSSLQVRFFTREMGVIDCLYRGGRKPGKHALVQPFSALWLSVNLRRDFFYINTVESTETILDLQGNALFTALYLNELIYYTIRPQDPCSWLFDSYELTLNALQITNDKLAIEIVLRQFEKCLLSTCGYSLNLSEEASTGDAITADHYYQFIPGTGFLLSRQGFQGSDILAFANQDFSRLSVLKMAKAIMRQAIDHLLAGRELKSRALFLIPRSE
ncbi:DNA repair protein RecO [Legionella quinlivanii]|uniref:DNA repair protein RecO n=1 Tax=Legionella quinlivanii TaxID=45073 RepID=A0A364LJ02_9GAMM|nr:DNA repair protein RecO [Legionella quinlivanii]RAP36412.1 DNA repair protein RecO [Legionella quinlivanii]